LNLTAAIRERDPAQLPGKRDEDWRWTDLRGLIRTVPPPSQTFDADDLGAGPFAGLADSPLIVINGRAEDSSIAVRNRSATTILRFVSRGGGSHATDFRVVVDPGARLTLLESYEGDDSGYLAQTSLTFEVGEGAEVERIVLAADGAEGVSVSQADVKLAVGASFAQTVLLSGARRQRIETRVAHPGGGAKLRLDGVYLLADKRHADLTTVVTHQGADGVTMQMAKGVVRDQSRGIFQGRIVVAQGADRTDARMEHHALILSDRAEVDAKPELEIYADDVACSHGNTVGALDEDALFYARQRGIPEDEARSMLTEAFIGEVIDRIGHEGARGIARAWATERLRG
jgi:Fe-S cluster assembly protein SufD